MISQQVLEIANVNYSTDLIVKKEVLESIRYFQRMKTISVEAIVLTQI